MTDIEIELIAFLGSDFGASVTAEIGEEAVALIFLAGARAQLGIDEQDYIRIMSGEQMEDAA